MNKGLILWHVEFRVEYQLERLKELWQKKKVERIVISFVTDRGVKR